jgi:hypothetical protein
MNETVPDSILKPLSRMLPGVLLLSAAALAFEINLTRLFSVMQFYHFAFMVVSLALLGFGASGTFLAIFPSIVKEHLAKKLGWIAAGQAVSIVGSYLFINSLPFDSFSLAYDTRQVILLITQLLALALPFFFNGLVVGILLATDPAHAGRTYAANLLGSAAGCLVALVTPSYIGGEGIVTLCSGISALAGILFYTASGSKGMHPRIYGTAHISGWVFTAGILLLIGFSITDLSLRLFRKSQIAFMELNLSPYKSLSYALQVPGSEVISRKWNAYARVDIVSSPGIRSMPGLSYRYLDALPVEDGLLVDGDDLSPILRGENESGFYSYLPAAIAYILRPRASALVIEAHGGLDIQAALTSGASQVTAVEVNPLIVEAAQEIYRQPSVILVPEMERSYLRKATKQFDVVQYSLTSSYRPVRSGAYSLSEDYRNTIESFQDSLSHLKPGGLLVVTRWLQNPPSECLKTFALAVTALEKNGGDPAQQIVALRGYNTLTILVKESPFAEEELQVVRSFATERAFDLVFAPGLSEEQSNTYNVMAEPVYFRTFQDLVYTVPRQDFYEAYPYEVSPPTDDRPFFAHFFKWSQAKQIAAEFGKTMQPFGGAGYFMLLGLLVLAVLSACLIILLPLYLSRKSTRSLPGQGETGKDQAYKNRRWAVLVYFGMLGLAYLLVEIPLIQRFILYLGQPAYAMTSVLFALLLFSALGSQLSRRIPIKFSLAALTLLLIAIPAFLPWLFAQTLGLSLAYRLGLTVVVLAPLGFLMGIPFPSGISQLLRAQGADLVPWAWGINGALSVVASVLAALLAISFGFSRVFWLGAACYGIALLMVWVSLSPRLAPPLR